MNKRIGSLLISALFMVVLIALPSNASAAGSGSTAGIVTTAWGNLNVRGGNSVNTPVVATLYNGGYITLLSKNGNWWKVEYGRGKSGYCSADYIKPVEKSHAAYIAVNYGNLNVRSSSSASSSIITRLPKGTGVVVLSQSNGWSKILYNGVSTGFVSSAYIRTYVSTNSATSYPAINLYVPSYKQLDSRWSNTRIGTTGNTIATAGCLTTALSMTESYRTGSTIYPNTLASRLNYTPDGSLYWPSNYSFSNNSSYLNTIYSLLKSGKPVLFGAKNSYGSQHWVVVKGYTGSSTLSAAGFTVNDPGSNSRTTLQHLLNNYPIFYKISYYV